LSAADKSAADKNPLRKKKTSPCQLRRSVASSVKQAKENLRMKCLNTCLVVAVLIGSWSCLAAIGSWDNTIAAQEAAPVQETAPATETPAAPPATPAATDQQPAAETKSLETLLSEFKELDAKLAAKQAEYDAATDENAKSDLRTEYLQLFNQADLQIGLIRMAAVAELKAKPGDVDLQKKLLGVLMQEAQSGRDAEVLEAGEALIAAGVDSKLLEQAAGAERISIAAKETLEELMLRQRDAAANLPRVKLTTSKGVVEIELFEDQAPNTVANFLELVGKKFYDGVRFHRVIEGFMAQSGDPKGDGSGGPGYTIACECYSPEARRHFTGSLSMAKLPARDTGGSQFFIVFKRSESTQQLDGKHTVFGRIVSGQDIVNSLVRTQDPPSEEERAKTDTILTAEVIRKRDHEYKVNKIGEVKAEAPAAPPVNPPTNPPAGVEGGQPAPAAEKSGG
jgi:cyclophilin family peptidyl-prolyl cis-trans isomerase